MFGIRRRPTPSDFRPVTQRDVDFAKGNIDSCYQRDDGVFIEHFCSYIWTNERRARRILDELRLQRSIGSVWYEVNAYLEERDGKKGKEFRAVIDMYKLPNV